MEQTTLAQPSTTLASLRCRGNILTTISLENLSTNHTISQEPTTTITDRILIVEAEAITTGAIIEEEANEMRTQERNQ